MTNARSSWRGGTPRAGVVAGVGVFRAIMLPLLPLLVLAIFAFSLLVQAQRRPAASPTTINNIFRMFEFFLFFRCKVQSLRNNRGSSTAQIKPRKGVFLAQIS